ncbi:MAG: myo-inosose-2 dehydratase [Lachnospirales bacterium]
MNKENVFLGIAPIGWTNDDLPELGGTIPFEQCISEMALAGYKGSEVGNKYPKDPGILKSFLEPRALEICNAWFSTYFTTKDEEETIKAFCEHRNFLHEMGAKVIGCSEQGRSIQGKNLSIFDEKPIFTDDEFKKLCNGYNKLAVLAEEKGMKVCLHHHMGTGIQTLNEIDKFLQETNKNVYLLFDTGHIYFSQCNQKAVDTLVEKHISRIVHVHLKDVREDTLMEIKEKKLSFLEGVKMGVFTVPGDGVINFDNTFKILDKNNYKGYMVVEAEQDPAKANPFKYAQKARAFIKEKTNI